WTRSVGIFHNDVAFLLQHETDKALNFLDDVTLLGPKTQYKEPDGTYETIPKNSNIFLHCLVHAGAMVSVKKLQLCQPEIIIVGRKCTYEGQEPDVGTVEKVLKWPECRNVSEVRGFLGMAGTVRNWIKGFAEVAHPLTRLTRVTKEEFSWFHLGTAQHGESMDIYDFGPGELVLVLNKKIKPNVGHKCKPRYFGPMVVVKRLRSGAYILAEVNGAVSHLKFVAFHIIPYHP
ncbi:Pol polyprotein, partial [Leucoagaricus sp. SymC.cos]